MKDAVKHRARKDRALLYPAMASPIGEDDYTSIRKGAGTYILEAIFDCPYVIVTYRTSDSSPAIAAGFAKVNWPDKWNPFEGLRIASERARKEFENVCK